MCPPALLHPPAALPAASAAPAQDLVLGKVSPPLFDPHEYMLGLLRALSLPDDQIIDREEDPGSPYPGKFFDASHKAWRVSGDLEQTFGATG